MMNFGDVNKAQDQVKQLDLELTKFQRAKVFVESDLCRVKVDNSTIGVRKKKF
jgi:hypothetical protein